jgi:hypothetical protein
MKYYYCLYIVVVCAIFSSFAVFYIVHDDLTVVDCFFFLSETVSTVGNIERGIKPF